MSQVEQKNYYTFVGGLNTEGGYLTSVPNTWKEGYNVIPKYNGELHRRRAVDFEDAKVLSTPVSATIKSSLAHTVEQWNTVGGKGTRNFIVVQTGPTLSFYDNIGGTVSATKKSYQINLADYAVNTSVIGTAPITCASGNGKLLITSADTSPLVVTYNEVLDNISVKTIDIKIRDFGGLDDSLAVDNRPSTLSKEHNYNLLNQGWNTTNINAYKAAGSFLYPSNAQVWTAGKNSSDVFTPSLLDLQDFGTTPAPKGRFVLDVFNRDRSTVSGVAGITVETETYRPNCVAFFAGRAWYAGINSNKISSWVLFSQVAADSEEFGKCYQDADPTSEAISDLVPSDGGVIPIQDVGIILKLIPLGTSMIVLADNGIWQIVGNDSGFSADTYAVNKLSSIGCTGAKTVVPVESTALFWGAGGIYAFTQEINASNITAGTYSINPITDLNIQSFYNSIPINSASYAAGVYNEEEKIIYWAYNSDPLASPTTDRFNKDTILCYDLRLKAFYVHSVAELNNNSPVIIDMFVSKSRAEILAEYDVVTGLGGLDTVQSNSSGVQSVLSTGVATKRINKFWTVVPLSTTSFSYTVSDMNNSRNADTAFKDWYSADGVGVTATPYILTGFDNANKEFSGTYAVCYSKRTETGIQSNGTIINPSSILLQSRWDWTDSSGAGRWSTPQQAYRHKRVFLVTPPSSTFDDSYPVVVSKLKVRGSGRSVQFKWYGEPEKDFKLTGWGIIYVAEDNV